MKNLHLIWRITFLLLITFKVTRTLRVKGIKILNKYVKVGDDVDLVCVFELNNERIHSLKWYKEEREFFRIEGNRSTIQFPVKGIQLDKSKSNIHRIRLKNVNESTHGTFYCEVCVEGSFYTEDSEVFLSVHANIQNSGLINNIMVGPLVLFVNMFILHRYLSVYIC